MTLATHTIVGTAVASLFPEQFPLAFSLAFMSHFALDSIPHWDYALASGEKDEKNPMNSDIALSTLIRKNLPKIILDICIGVLLSTGILWFFGKPIFLTVLAGMLGGVLPDALQVVYTKFRHEPLVTLQRFHIWIQRHSPLKVSPLVGLSLQATVICIVYFFLVY